MKTVVIHPGFLEGEYHFKFLTELIKNEGHTAIIHACLQDESTSANLHVTHSAALLCPDVMQGQTRRVIVAPPFGMNKKRSMISKVVKDFGYAWQIKRRKFWLKKTLASTKLLFSKPIHWYKYSRHFKRHFFMMPIIMETTNSLVIISSKDRWTLRQQHILKRHHSVAIGEHDDIVYHPQNYMHHIIKALK